MSWAWPEVRATSLEAVQDAILAHRELILSQAPQRWVRPPHAWNHLAPDGAAWLRPSHDAFELFAEDFIVQVSAWLPLAEVQARLAEDGLTLPFAPEFEPDPEAMHWPLAEWVGAALPHGLEAAHGSWREWILGTTGVTGDGVIFRSGSRVAKNVAGFDLHTFLVGSEHSFAVPWSYTLRVVARSAVRPSPVEHGPQVPEPDARPRLHRVLPEHWEALVRSRGDHWWRRDPLTHTLCWLVAPDVPDAEVKSFGDDWIYAPGTSLLGPDELWAMSRAKSLFDPELKLQPGLFDPNNPELGWPHTI